MIYDTEPLVFTTGLLVMFGIFSFMMAALSRSRFWVEQWFKMGVIFMGILVGLWIAAAVGLVQ